MPVFQKFQLIRVNEFIKKTLKNKKSVYTSILQNFDKF